MSYLLDQRAKYMGGNALDTLRPTTPGTDGGFDSAMSTPRADMENAEAAAAKDAEAKSAQPLITAGNIVDAIIGWPSNK